MDAKQFGVITLCAIVVLTLFLLPISSLGAPAYDPWADYNGDGIIDIDDILPGALAFGSSGDPTKNVNITNPSVVILPAVTWYIYSAPFLVCTNPTSQHPNPYGVGYGTYETDILVHNPSATQSVSIKKKVVYAYPEPSTGEIHWIGSITLPPDGAFRIDSPEIVPQPTGLTKGFVVLIANSPYLDVVAVNTVTSTLQVGLNTDMELLTINPKPYGFLPPP